MRGGGGEPGGKAIGKERVKTKKTSADSEPQEVRKKTEEKKEKIEIEKRKNNSIEAKPFIHMLIHSLNAYPNFQSKV